jgi:hypothetical protein
MVIPKLLYLNGVDCLDIGIGIPDVPSFPRRSSRRRHREPPSPSSRSTSALGSCRDEAGPSTSHRNHHDDDEGGGAGAPRGDRSEIDPWAGHPSGGSSSQPPRNAEEGTGSGNGKRKEPAHDSDMLLNDPYDALHFLEPPVDLESLTLPTFAPPALPNDLELLQPLYQPLPDLPSPLPDDTPPDPPSTPLIGWTPTTVDVAAK